MKTRRILRISAIVGITSMAMGLFAPISMAASSPSSDGSDSSSNGYDSLAPIATSADATSKTMTISVKSSSDPNASPSTESKWSDSVIVDDHKEGAWRIVVSNGSSNVINNVTITSSVSGCSENATTIPAGYKKTITCKSTLNSDAIKNDVTASAPIDPTISTSKMFSVSDSALMLPVTSISEIFEDGKTCPVQYDTNIKDQRDGNKDLLKSTVDTVYKKNPSVASCIEAAKGQGSFTSFSANKYGRFIYKISTTYDNPKVWKKSVGADWEIIPNGALLPENMTTEAHVSYARLTCNADWSGAQSSSPYTDVVTKNGKNYTLLYTQDDCSALPQELKCVSSGSTTASTTVPASSAGSDYSQYSKWITNGVSNPESEDTITVIRNGEVTPVDYAVPNLAYGTWFASNGFSTPQTNTSAGIMREILKDRNGTPWNDNVTARKDPTLSEGSSSSTNADKADFTIGNKSGTWVKNITNTTITRWVPSDVNKYWEYPMGKDSNPQFSFASRWVSDENDGATKLRQKFDIRANVSSSQTIITGISFNGTLTSKKVTKTFDTRATCVSGIGNVKTVRAVNNE